jgi:hypothetical protein
MYVLMHNAGGAEPYCIINTSFLINVYFYKFALVELYK